LDKKLVSDRAGLALAIRAGKKHGLGLVHDVGRVGYDAEDVGAGDSARHVVELFVYLIRVGEAATHQIRCLS
jgi:hypothetical protein